VPKTIHSQSDAYRQEDTVPPPLAEIDLPEPEHKVDDSKKEIGGRDGPDPTRYGDWEMAGRCIDF
jgi:hypothetical protein